VGICLSRCLMLIVGERRYSLFYVPLCPLLLAVLLLLFGRSHFPSTIPNTPCYPVALKNELRNISFVRYHREMPQSPTFSLYLKRLQLQSNNLALFKTALHLLLSIHDLRLKFYSFDKPLASVAGDSGLIIDHQTRYSNTNALKAALPSFMSTADLQPCDLTSIAQKLLAKLQNPSGTWHLENIKLGNISELAVAKFACDFYHNNQLQVSIRSKTAHASYKQPYFTLRGHVTIKTGDESILEANCVKWDIFSGQFNVDGDYCLTKTQTVITGRNACLDNSLHILNTQNSNVCQKEQSLCLAEISL